MAETQRILEVLRSPETPSVKKQQVMNRVFGDCRLKMAEDQKSMDKADVKAGDVEVQQTDGQASDGKQSNHIFEAKPEWFTSPDNSFRFDFPLPKTDLEATGPALEAAPGGRGAEKAQTDAGAAEQDSWNGVLSFAASEQESRFAFNFAILNEDHPLVPLVPTSQHRKHSANCEVLGSSLPMESAGVPQISAMQKPELTETAGSVPKEDGSLVTLKIPQPETAPGGETVTEKPAAEGAAQKKKKKKKQKPSVSKKETEETEINRKAKAEANRCQNKGASHQDETSQSDEQLRKEVDWCVEQLELGLKTQKSTPKQAEEALRAIKTLRSNKAPLVKKRQVMRAIFGDYRKKMEEERCKELKLMEAAAKSARIVEVKGNACNKNCRFFRKRSGACRTSQGSAETPAESPRTLTTDSFQFPTSQEEFYFNFF
ncbi:UPF0488 protein C8orf33 homolog isoform X2 [Phaenicophaeus curvirostris]|uniref:UPF0488 protein C8orf33 homolog isoform X2 n=1 Tax=Phaenicophaeus curvirostris TaxID=33595 RepID=UPI0037F0C268